MSKYGNKRIILDGLTFDSRHEASRWVELNYLQRAHIITGLARQVKYELIPAQKDEKGKVIEKACSYIADFVYSENGRLVVEDAKSEATRTPAYRIKKKLMLQKYGIRIREV